MRPRVTKLAGFDARAITTVLNKAQPTESIIEFRYLVKKHSDPRERYEAAVTKMQVRYFQYPKTFSDCLTASFAPDTAFVDALTEQGATELEFEQSSQTYVLPVTVERLKKGWPMYDATYWHNALFNPNLSGDAQY